MPPNTDHIHTLPIINETHEADTARIETCSQTQSQLLLQQQDAHLPPNLQSTFAQGTQGTEMFNNT